MARVSLEKPEVIENRVLIYLILSEKKHLPQCQTGVF